jgi:UDP-N-acetyl-2-amino-2-deoxyglucuronate dehydrogenase
MSKQWKCAVVGAATVGQTHVRVIPQLPNATLAAVCDVNPERAKAAIEKANVPGTPIYKDMAEMLDREQIDVVHLATPSGMHFDGCKLAMERGKNVICEKPLEIRLERIDQMIELSQRTGMKLATIFQNRWSDANRAIKSAMDEGRFGKLAWAGCFTPWYRPDKYYTDGGWRGTWKLDGGGAIMNQSIHNIDLLQWIAGPIKSVSAYASSRIHPTIETEDTCSVALEFASGAFGTILGTTAMFPGMPVRFEIGGENGTAVQENGLKFFKFRDERPADAELLAKLAPKPPGAPGVASTAAAVGSELHARNITAILAAWDEGREAETSGPESRKAVAIVHAIYESVRNRGAAVLVK